MKMQRQDSLRTRRNLLEAASAIFAEKGFRETTIAEISQRAGANVAAVNYHFGDKETLYREAWRYSFTESIKVYPPDGGVAATAPPERRLTGRVRALLTRISADKNREFTIAIKEIANPTGLLEEVMQEEMRPLRREIMALVREVLGPGHSEEEVRFCTISIVGQCVIPTLINMARLARLGNEDNEPDSLKVDDTEAYAEHVVAFSLAGMGAVGRENRKRQAVQWERVK